jgi:hypothetical protein
MTIGTARRGKNANLPGFLLRNKISAGITGSSEGLALFNRRTKLSRRLPFEHATLAKRDEVARFADDIKPCSQNITCSMIRLLAPIKFTGSAALSVETLK